MLRIISSIALCIVCFSGVYAQETIDQRLVKNRGKQAEDAFVYNKNGYNYFLFELDKSHWIADKSTLTEEEKANLQPAANFKNAQNQVLTLEVAKSEQFNFYDFGIKLQRDGRVCIALDQNNVLMFYAIPELTRLFSSSDLNVK
jgi:hypothetical protein